MLRLVVAFQQVEGEEIEENAVQIDVSGGANERIPIGGDFAGDSLGAVGSDDSVEFSGQHQTRRGIENFNLGEVLAGQSIHERYGFHVNNRFRFGVLARDEDDFGGLTSDCLANDSGRRSLVAISGIPQRIHRVFRLAESLESVQNRHDLVPEGYRCYPTLQKLSQLQDSRSFTHEILISCRSGSSCQRAVLNENEPFAKLIGL